MTTRPALQCVGAAASHAIYGQRLRIALTLLGTLIGAVLLPAGSAQAHGGGQPVATSYLAKLSTVPTGLDARVVDGDLRLWLRVPASTPVTVLDYRGAPYLRYDRSGVQVNHNSAMYYLNQTPVAETPPANLTATTPPDWQPASSAHDYAWHDGRLHALATIALTPGTRYVGTWTIPLINRGRRAAITGGLWHAERPSLVWFWPLVVLLACVIAASRLRRPGLNAHLARVLGITTILALAVAGAGRELHGHPNISPTQDVELAIILAFAAWGLYRLLLQKPGSITYFVIAFAALWQGIGLIPVLRDGFVLIDLPAFVARTATLLCLACGAAILLLVFRRDTLPERTPAPDHPQTTSEVDADDRDEAWEVR